MFKPEFKVESYVQKLMSLSHRHALAKFQCGVAPLRLETGRYANIPEHEQCCFNCEDKIESELHVLVECPVYENFRDDLYDVANQKVANFDQLSSQQKLCAILSNSSIAHKSAKTCHMILERRHELLFK